MEGLQGKVVIVTGASSGIGATTAEEFAKYGVSLSLTGRNTERLQAVSLKCQQRGLDEKKILLVSCDLTQDDALDKIINQTVETFGKIDILVNNAGMVQPASFQQMTMDNLDAHYKILLRAPLFLSQKALPYLKQTEGNIVNVSSVSSSRSSVQEMSYGIAKAGLDYFTKALSVELGPLGIRVNAVNPGDVKTNILASLSLEEEEKDASVVIQDYAFNHGDPRVSCDQTPTSRDGGVWYPGLVTGYSKYFKESALQYPLGRVAEPREVATAIVFLASGAASFITGATLPVDGGVGNTTSWTLAELNQS